MELFDNRARSIIPFLNVLYEPRKKISNKMNIIAQTRRTKYGALCHSVTRLVPFVPP
jgi:hypothetical protein